jgi:hypothetical protein
MCHPVEYKNGRCNSNNDNNNNNKMKQLWPPALLLGFVKSGYLKLQLLGGSLLQKQWKRKYLILFIVTFALTGLGVPWWIVRLPPPPDFNKNTTLTIPPPTAASEAPLQRPPPPPPTTTTPPPKLPSQPKLPRAIYKAPPNPGGFIYCPFPYSSLSFWTNNQSTASTGYSSSSSSSDNNNIILPTGNSHYQWCAIPHKTSKNPSQLSWVWRPKTTTTNGSETPNDSYYHDPRGMLIRGVLDQQPSFQWGLDSILEAHTQKVLKNKKKSSGASSLSVQTTTTATTTAPPSLSSSVVFYGCSHLREVYFAMIRLKRGLPYTALLEREATFLPSCAYNFPQFYHRCNKTSVFMKQLQDVPCGIQLDNCGATGKRLVPELSSTNTTTTPNVAFGFKSYLHSPDADALFVDFLYQRGLRHPTVLLVDMGIWGPRHQHVSATSNTTNTPMAHYTEEMDYYLTWLRTTFPNSHIVYVYEDMRRWGSQYSDDLLQRFLAIHYRNTTTTNENGGKDGDEPKQQKSSLLLRKDWIQPVPLNGLPCVHGCGGPVTEVMARLVLSWMQKLLLSHDDEEEEEET